MISKIIVITTMLIILGTLASGLMFLVQNKREGKSLLHALMWRIALSMGLFIFLMIGFYMGWLTPHAL